MQTILEEMDADLAAMDDTGAAAAAATQVEMASAAAAGEATAVDSSETPGQLRVRPLAQRVAMQANASDVVIDPRLLSKPGSCPTEHGASWRLWRTKLEGWTFGVDNRIGQVVVQASEHPVVISTVPQHLKQVRNACLLWLVNLVFLTSSSAL